MTGVSRRDFLTGVFRRSSERDGGRPVPRESRETKETAHPGVAVVAETELPDLNQAILDPETLADLFRDIAACTELIAVIPKRSGLFCDPSPVGLEEGHRLLRDGDVRGLQIRYLHAGGEWWDTLIRLPQGVKLVRIRHDPD